VKLCYVAAAYSSPNGWQVEMNTRLAETAALLVAQRGVSVIVPHTMSRFWGCQLPDSFWYPATLEMLRRCDAIVLADCRRSKGVAAELAEAQRLGLEVFDLSGAGGMAELERLAAWARGGA